MTVQEDISHVFIDEKIATSIAYLLNLKPVPLSYIPIWGCAEGHVKYRDAERMLDDLLISKYYLSMADYKRLKDLLKALKKQN